MAHARAAALICACALFANAAAKPAPAPPKRCDNNKEVKMVHERTIVVRRLPAAYLYPFSLWPIPKYQTRDHEDTHGTYQQRRSLNKGQNRRNQR